MGAQAAAQVAQKLNYAIADILKAPDAAKRFAADGSTPRGSKPEQFDAHIKSEIAKWTRLARDAKLELYN